MPFGPLTWSRDGVEENGLTIQPTKTRIVDARTTPFDFLDYTFCGQEPWLRFRKNQARHIC